MFQPAKKYVRINVISKGKVVQMSMSETKYRKILKLVEWNKLHWIVRFWLSLFGKKKGFLND